MPEIIARTKGRVRLLKLNRPQKLNALSSSLFVQLNKALDRAEEDDAIGAIVIIGGARAFAAGADITETVNIKSFAEVAARDFVSGLWERIPACRKPVIAAVRGYALGGGCELAMMCDMIIAAEDAKFAQPEINLGTIPGAGGTQRMARAIGKAKTMDMCLTGRMMDAHEAERAGLVSRVVADADLEKEALAIAAQIAAQSLPVVRLVKEAVNAAFETPLAQGIKTERRLFHSTFALEDRREGMRAFIEKRRPKFKHR